MRQSRLGDGIRVGTCYHPYGKLETKQTLFDIFPEGNQFEYYCGRCGYIWQTLDELQDWMRKAK